MLIPIDDFLVHIIGGFGENIEFEDDTNLNFMFIFIAFHDEITIRFL